MVGRFVRCCVEDGELEDSSRLEECERSVTLAYRHLLLAGLKPTQWHGPFATQDPSDFLPAGRPARSLRGTQFQGVFGVEGVACTYIEASSKGFGPR